MQYVAAADGCCFFCRFMRMNLKKKKICCGEHGGSDKIRAGKVYERNAFLFLLRCSSLLCTRKRKSFEEGLLFYKVKRELKKKL